jgi:hypothetical protein
MRDRERRRAPAEKEAWASPDPLRSRNPSGPFYKFIKWRIRAGVRSGAASAIPSSPATFRSVLTRAIRPDTSGPPGTQSPQKGQGTMSLATHHCGASLRRNRLRSIVGRASRASLEADIDCLAS